MPLIDQVKDEIVVAMKAKDKVRLTTLRSIRAAMIETLKADGSETMSDDTAVALLRRLAKQRRESIDAYEKGGRPELAEQEQAELAIIEDFLPKLADEATTRGWVQQAIASTGASAPGDMGKVMGALMKGHKDEMDAKLANQIVRELLK